MHELSVTESIIEIALRHAKANQIDKITKINVTLGELSSIVDDSVRFYWPILTKGTICEDAQLVFERISAEITCNDCGHAFHPPSIFIPCEKCGSSNVKLTRGTEFFVDSIEYQDDEES